MTPQQIIDDVFMLDKSITISFPSRTQFNSLRSQLYIYQQRMTDKMRAIGMDDPFAGKRIQAEWIRGITGHSELVYRFYVGEMKVKKPVYTILALDELPKHEHA